MQIEIPEIISVKDLAAAINQPVAEVMKKLISFGVLASLNEDIDFETASIIADEFGVSTQPVVETDLRVRLNPKEDAHIGASLQPRPPVVTIMGHVDHGKTTLLDYIRKSAIAKSEAGGITQHLSSYLVKIKDRDITFIDTPGHAAFEATRKQGAFVADLIILVIAADDGVKPQTIEVISLANEKNIPILVAINKIDKPEADIEKAKRQLSELGLSPEEWGGKTIMSPIVATTGEGVDKMLEMIFLISDLKELKASLNVPATGIIIESHMTPGVGPQSTILVQNGTLNISDFIVSGDTVGKIRTMTGGDQKKTTAIKPGYSGIISGLSGLPEFGHQFFAVDSEKSAKNIAKDFQRKMSVKTIRSIKEQNISTEKEQGKVYYKIILKSDTEASSQAIISSLQKLENEDVGVKIVSSDIGDINESDISYAKAAKCSVIGFNINLSNELKKLARRESIEIDLYSVIYELLESLELILKSLMPVIKIEIEIAELKILAIFRDNKKNKVLGGMVRSGTLTKGSVKIMREAKLLGKGEIVALKRGKQDAKQVVSGSECGLEIRITEFEDTKLDTIEIKPSDLIVQYEIKEQKKPWNINQK